MNGQHNPPEVSSLVPGGIFFAFQKDPLEFLLNAASLGEVVRYRLLGSQFYLLSSPTFVKDILFTRHADFIKGRVLQKSKVFMGEGLITSQEPLHGRQRHLVQRAFHKQRLSVYATAMVYLARSFVASWEDNQERDLHADMMQLTLRIVTKALFGIEMESEAVEIGAHFTELIESAMFFYAVPYADRMLNLPIPKLRRIRTSLAYIDSVIYRFIEEGRHAGEDRGDLLSMLIAAHDEDLASGRTNDKQLRDECVSLFAAGHETTANALSWTFYLLSQHSSVEEKLSNELRAILGERQPTFDDIPRLKYAKMVMAESMRLFPPAWIISRQAIKDYQAGPYLIPAGSFITLSPWVMHHSGEHFPEPERFDPERWKDDANASKMAFRYIPFGAGPRNCIGEGFAWVEGLLILAAVLQSWKVELLPGFKVEPDAHMTLRPRTGVKVVLRRRVGTNRAVSGNS